MYVQLYTEALYVCTVVYRGTVCTKVLTLHVHTYITYVTTDNRRAVAD